MSFSLLALYITIMCRLHSIYNQSPSVITNFNIPWINYNNLNYNTFSNPRIIICEKNTQNQIFQINSSVYIEPNIQNLITNNYICYITNQDHTWIKCAAEHNYCNINGYRIISYGAEGIMTYKILSNSFICNNDQFGDPIGGVVKACWYYKNFDPNIFSWEYCSEKDKFCNFTGERIVRYGIQNVYLYKNYINGVYCIEKNFTIMPGYLEQCYYLKCSSESEYFHTRELKCFSLCPENLFVCYAEKMCYETCPENYKYKGKECFKDNCPENLLIDLDGKTCVEKCKPGIFKFGNECVKECPFEFKILNNYECIIDCAAYGYLFSIDDRNCIDKCPDNQVQYHDYPICVDKEEDL